MKTLIVFAFLFPIGLMAEKSYFLGENLGEAVQQQCNSSNNSCYEDPQNMKTNDYRGYYGHRPRSYYYRSPYYQRYYNPTPYYNYYPGPNYYPQQRLGYICRNGYYYCGMNYPAVLYSSCYCNLGYSFFYGTVTDY